MLIKKVLNWKDKKYDELLDSNDSDFVCGAKAFGIGALEGFIDSAVIIGAFVIVKDAVWLVKNIGKK